MSDYSTLAAFMLCVFKLHTTEFQDEKCLLDYSGHVIVTQSLSQPIKLWPNALYELDQPDVCVFLSPMLFHLSI